MAGLDHMEEWPAVVASQGEWPVFPGPGAAEVKDSGWFVSHRGKFSQDVNGRVKHWKESTKKEDADEKMSNWCRVRRPKGA